MYNKARRKGIILAGGAGTRLYPLTQVMSKQLLPIYDKPMIYYPLSVLMLACIDDILVITTPEDYPRFKKLLGDGSHLNVNIQYKQQEKPDGIAQAFIIGEDFIQDSPVCLILGDNIFYGQDFRSKLLEASSNTSGATIFGYQVKDPTRFGIVEFGKDNKLLSVEEKPKKPKSNYAVTGLYFYDHKISKIAKTVLPSARGELEITSINQAYLDRGELSAVKLGRGFLWLDTGTHKSLLEAGQFVEMIETRQGLKIACLEEIAYVNGWISDKELRQIGNSLSKSGYGNYLLSILEDRV